MSNSNGRITTPVGKTPFVLAWNLFVRDFTVWIRIMDLLKDDLDRDSKNAHTLDVKTKQHAKAASKAFKQVRSRWNDLIDAID